MKLSGLKVRSKIWDSTEPSDDNIGLYFFPHEMRHDANLDQLINEVMEHDLVLRAIIGEDEMLIFPSCLLPERYKTFQRKHYLWALFKPREDKFAAAAKPLNDTAWRAQEDEHVSNQQDDEDNVEPNKEIILMKNAMPLESQRLVSLHHCMEKQSTEGSARGGMDDSVNCKSPAVSTRQVSASCVPGAASMGCQLETPDRRKQEDYVHTAEATAAAVTNSSARIAGATAHTTSAANIPANHELFNSSMGVPLGKMKQEDCVNIAEATAAATNSSARIAEATAHTTSAANVPENHELFNSSMDVPLGKIFFVARQTSRVEQIRLELDREGSLEFVARTEAIGAWHGPGSIATSMLQ